MGKVTKHKLRRQLQREERHKQWLKDNLPGSAQQRQNQYRILPVNPIVLPVRQVFDWVR